VNYTSAMTARRDRPTFDVAALMASRNVDEAGRG
jgi:hypothetical protein